ncbi:MmcQ/YjbR family DNA-binding protein [Kribbella monticola]|uniref:MmcQ/YjbR family DNA-binding protein n=1 Tax=Kribbella monticola TaxID=2185285 RepID=UPI000DD34840|nr:MmcQ/YjbR family DNA-binding protein [Kribbella monticola]
MADQDDVRRIALGLPEVTESADTFAFSVPNKGKDKAFAWVWNERVEPKKPRVPNPGVLAIRVAGAAAKEELLAADPAKFFTEPHYNGYPAVLVRLAAVDATELTELLTDAWRCQAPRALITQLDAD